MTIPWFTHALLHLSPNSALAHPKISPLTRDPFKV